MTNRFLAFFVDEAARGISPYDESSTHRRDQPSPPREVLASFILTIMRPRQGERWPMRVSHPAARHLRPAVVSSVVIALHVQHAGLLGAQLQLFEEAERDTEEEKDEDARREAGFDVLHENLVDCRG